MKEEKKEVKSEKKIDTKIIGIVAIVIILVVVVVFFATKGIRLESGFKKLGADFYTNYYYEKTAKDKDSKEITSFFKSFEEIGIKVSLSNLEKYSSKGNEKTIEKLKNAKCDEAKSMITIYPKKPYGKNDYKIEAKLSCNK